MMKYLLLQILPAQLTKLLSMHHEAACHKLVSKC